MIVQSVEPDFLDGIDAFPKAKAKKIKLLIKALVGHMEQSETIDDLRRIDHSNMAPSAQPHLHLLAGRQTEQHFPKMDLYLFAFDEFRVFFCLRGQVCTLLRAEDSG